MKCQNCGKEFDQQYPHCPWCGEQATIQSDVPDPPTETNVPFADKEPSMSDIYKTIVPPAKKKMSTGAVAVITCSIFLVVLVFVGFMVQNTALTGSRSSSSVVIGTSSYALRPRPEYTVDHMEDITNPGGPERRIVYIRVPDRKIDLADVQAISNEFLRYGAFGNDIVDAYVLRIYGPSDYIGGPATVAEYRKGISSGPDTIRVVRDWEGVPDESVFAVYASFYKDCFVDNPTDDEANVYKRVAASLNMSVDEVKSAVRQVQEYIYPS